MAPWTRRRFLSVLGCGAVAAGFAGPLPPKPLVPLRRRRSASELGDLSALVKWIREAPADSILRGAIDRLRAGLPPQELWAATFLAGIEDVEPRPVGFRFHCVMVMPPLWQVATALPPDEQLLPLIFGLWNFKQAQEGDARANDWTLCPVDESRLPAPEKARAALSAAFESWDPPAADVAIAQMARTATRDEIVATLVPYGLRNFTAVGHHPIFMTSAFKTLDVIGWRHAEPVLRSLAWGLLAPGPSDEAKPFARSRATAEKLAAARGTGEARGDEPAAPVAQPRITRSSLSPSSDAAIAATAAEIGAGSGAIGLERAWSDLQSIGLELMMETPGLLAVHSTTGTLALRELAARSSDPTMQIAGALQSAAWMPLWRRAFRGGGDAPESTFEQLARDAGPGSGSSSKDDAVSSKELLASLGGGDSRAVALRIARATRDDANARAFLDGARRVLVAKAGETHHYKFFAALEDVVRGSPPGSPAGSPISALRLAAGSFYLHGPKEPDFEPVAEARAALGRKV